MLTQIVQFLFQPTVKYLDPGTGSILIQIITAALGGGLFFYIKSKWKNWFGKKKMSDKLPNPEETKNTMEEKENIKFPKFCPNCKKKVDKNTAALINDETIKCPACGELIEGKSE